jgi:hypothetical protein
MEDIVIVAGLVCTNPVLVCAGHLEGRLAGVEFTRIQRCLGNESAAKLGSLSLKSSSAQPGRLKSFGLHG